MDISSVQVISLKEEMDYLDTYLSLERMRFDQKFDYHIRNKITDLQTEDVLFPSMILQPYVENAIRHGLRHKTNGPGRLDISFERQNGFVLCCVDDNGIGRQRAADLKSKRHVEYQSKGVKLAEDRVYLYNRVHIDQMKVETVDKVNEQSEASGTLVKVFVPLNTDL
jgi:LytS/YehU family sensor histidine kinase